MRTVLCIALVVPLLGDPGLAQVSPSKSSPPTRQLDAVPLRRTAMMDGNSIKVAIYDDGSIAPGRGLVRHVTNLVWNGLGDLYTAAIVVGAEVVDTSGHTIHILSDAINDIQSRDANPVDPSWVYGWRAKSGFANPKLGLVATNNDVESWPSKWSQWQGLRGPGAVLGKKEAYFVMDDSANTEYAYFPFGLSRSRRGLGVDVAGRIFQFDDPDFSDVLFAHYTITNASPKPLAKVSVGFYIDVDVGGGYPIMAAESQDDLSAFDSTRDLVYYWDNDGIGNYNLRTHYDGVLLIETPGNPSDGIDNDGDGLVDESQTNGRDDDGDWAAANDDVGADGQRGTADVGEGDGVPTVGEPNFELLDRQESDELGLTSFLSWTWWGLALNDDELEWSLLHHGLVSTIPQMTDLASLVGSGDFSLAPGAVTHCSVAFVEAWDLAGELVDVGKIADQYDARFYSGEFGNPSLAMHLMSPAPAASVGGTVPISWMSSGVVQDRLVDIWYSNEYEQSWNLLAQDLPDNGTYSWDTRNVRDGSWYRLRIVGKKYGNRGFDVSKDFFAVDNPGNGAPDVHLLNEFTSTPIRDTIRLRWAAGDAEKVPLLFRILASATGGNAFQAVDSAQGVTECLLDTRRISNSYSAVIRVEATDGMLTSHSDSKPFFLFNTYRQIRDSTIQHSSGVATGIIKPIVADSSALTGHTYRITFDSVAGGLRYSVRDLNADVVRVMQETLGDIVGGGSLFDGMRIGFQPFRLGLDSARSGFEDGGVTTLTGGVHSPSVGIFHPAPVDVKFVFTVLDTTADGSYASPGDTLPNQLLQRIVVAPFRVSDLSSGLPLDVIVPENPKGGKLGRWDPGERIVILPPPAYRVHSGDVMMEVRFDSSVTPGVAPAVGAGTIFIARMNEPFTSNDSYEFVASSSNLGPSAVVRRNQSPSEFSLGQNFPNPFNPSTSITFTLPVDCTVRLEVYNTLGQRVARLVEGEVRAGEWKTTWNARSASGVYFYRLVARSIPAPARHFVQTKKMLLLR